MGWIDVTVFRDFFLGGTMAVRHCLLDVCQRSYDSGVERRQLACCAEYSVTDFFGQLAKGRRHGSAGHLSEPRNTPEKASHVQRRISQRVQEHSDNDAGRITSGK